MITNTTTNPILAGLTSVTAKHTRQRKREQQGKTRSRRSSLSKANELTLKRAAWAAIPEAYNEASAGGTLPASARQVYYAARPHVLAETGLNELKSGYFTQTLLVDYVLEHPEETADWDVTYDARGNFREPHTEIITPVGTLDVRHYVQEMDNHRVKPFGPSDFAASALFPTCGPANRFGAVLFIEKEGFTPLFQQTKLAERYDLAIVSTKGMPVVACRRLVDELCGPYGIPLLVLHDFDVAGFSILSTLQANNHDYFPQLDGRLSEIWDPFSAKAKQSRGAARYEYEYGFEVIDLGLRLDDVEDYDLPAEEVYLGRQNPRKRLKRNGATDEEIEFLMGDGVFCGQRVELNAFNSQQFIDWVEAKLKQNGIEKVVPDRDSLALAYRRAVQAELVEAEIRRTFDGLRQQAEKAVVPENIETIVQCRLENDPTISWDVAVAEAARQTVKGCDGDDRNSAKLTIGHNAMAILPEGPGGTPTYRNAASVPALVSKGPRHPLAAETTALLRQYANPEVLKHWPSRPSIH